MSNLLNETLAILRENKKYVSDILWCSIEVENKRYFFSMYDFIQLADFEYPEDSAWGGFTKVNDSLKIVGKNWWLERQMSNEKCENWAFKTLPKKPKLEFKPNKLKSEHF